MVCIHLKFSVKYFVIVLCCMCSSIISFSSSFRLQTLLYSMDVQGGSNMTGTDFFFENHNCQTLTCTCQSSTYSPLESTHFFQRSGSILMPFSKKACGWRRIHSRTVWMTADDHAVHSPRALCPL
jgi:hypothetical protein